MTEAAELGVPVTRVLFKNGWISPRDYMTALAVALDTPTIASPELAGTRDFAIDATSRPPEFVAQAVRSAQERGQRPALFVSDFDRHISSSETIAQSTVKHAIEHLRVSAPAASAGRRMWLWQYCALATGIGFAGGLAVAAPDRASALMLYISAALFAAVALYRLALLIAAIGSSGSPYVRASPRTEARDLPTYSLLVPLFREAEIVPGLIDALENLDYPRSKLDIVLILEECDTATREAAMRANLPGHIRTIVVPDRQPRTKPKALNMALALTRGKYVAVFDAEDTPDSGQLRRAATAFEAHEGRFACLQARLRPHNVRQSWISRHFAMEYAALFHVILPALIRLGLPIPLSGTSNHFPRSVLEKAHWDPFNVTEDADLGVRLTRLGGRIGLIDCETLEEAPTTFRQWLPQRTRWIKGWMQTYLVHNREPCRTFRELGLWRTIGMHAIFGGYLLSALAFPVFFVLLGFELGQPEPFTTRYGSVHHLAMAIALLDMLAGTGAALIVAVLGIYRGGLSGLKWQVAVMPAYWMLISVAAYRALFQFIMKPHMWEKTPHSARSASGKRRSNQARLPSPAGRSRPAPASAGGCNEFPKIASTVGGYGSHCVHPRALRRASGRRTDSCGDERAHPNTAFELSRSHIRRDEQHPTAHEQPGGRDR